MIQQKQIFQQKCEDDQHDLHYQNCEQLKITLSDMHIKIKETKFTNEIEYLTETAENDILE